MTSRIRLQNAGIPEGSVERLMIRNSSPPQRTSTSDLRTTVESLSCNELQKPVSRRMAVPIVYFLEKIHVDHDEDQIAMIQFPNVASSRALIVSQNLSGFCRKNLFQITPVPHSGQNIGERDFLQLQILALQFQTVPAQRMFFAFQFIFQPAHFIQVLPRQSKQAEQLLIEQMLFRKTQARPSRSYSHGQQQPIGANALRRMLRRTAPKPPSAE